MKRSPVIWIAAICGVALAGVLAWWRTASAPAPMRTGEVAPPVHGSRRTAGAAAVPAHLLPLLETGRPYQVRLDYLRNLLSQQCSEVDIRALYRLLEHPPKGELAEHWYVIANDLMEQLRQHDADGERLSGRLLGILDDPAQPAVVRDYAVQHLASWLIPTRQNGPAQLPTGRGDALPGVPDLAPAATAPGTARPPDLAARVLERLAAAVKDPALLDTSVPGTALMMLVEISRSPADVDSRATVAALSPWLAQALSGESALPGALRVSAVQAAVAFAPATFLPRLREIAATSGGPAALRLPAVAALAQCGENADLALLDTLRREVPELAYAAGDAHRVLLSRLTRSHSVPLAPSSSSPSSPSAARQ